MDLSYFIKRTYNYLYFKYFNNNNIILLKLFKNFNTKH